ncbi:uncharacterized protein ACNS7B_010393 [Menidia menidia]
MSICVIVSLLLVVSPVCGKQSGFTLFNLKQYTKEMTWKEAQKFCRDKHIDLATVTSDKVFLGLWGWIGLYKENENGTWKWSEGNKTSNYTNWSATEPNYLDKEDCVYMDKKSKMFNEPCRRRHELICSDEKLDLVKENKTWEEALEHCRSLKERDQENPTSPFIHPFIINTAYSLMGSRGELEPINSTSLFRKNIYDLATLITADDHDYAREKAQQATTDEVWTGLRFLGDEWFWVGGEQLQYQNIPSCPTFRCGVLEKSSNKSFGIKDCNERNNFFCYKRPESRDDHLISAIQPISHTRSSSTRARLHNCCSPSDLREKDRRKLKAN